MKKNINKIVIAIDGHSSCGKSTLAKDIAARHGLTYIDTGAMYRAVTLFALRKGIITKDNINSDELLARIDGIKISFERDSRNGHLVACMNSEIVEPEIRSLEVSDHVSAISALPFVREHLVKLQQEMGREGGVVLDGRDIGTVVFPGADIKIFMTAQPEIRARRRFDEMSYQKFGISYQDVLDNVNSRDHLDSTRVESPLRVATGALMLDNSHLSREEQLEWVEEQLKNLGWLNY